MPILGGATSSLLPVGSDGQSPSRSRCVERLVVADRSAPMADVEKTILDLALLMGPCPNAPSRPLSNVDDEFTGVCVYCGEVWMGAHHKVPVFFRLQVPCSCPQKVWHQETIEGGSWWDRPCKPRCNMLHDYTCICEGRGWIPISDPRVAAWVVSEYLDVQHVRIRRTRQGNYVAFDASSGLREIGVWPTREIAAIESTLTLLSKKDM